MADNQEEAAKAAEKAKAEEAKLAADAAKKAKEEKAKAEDVRSRALAAAEEIDAMTPTPTQAELDQTKLGAHYKTRQVKA